MKIGLYIQDIPKNYELDYCNHWVEVRYNLPGQDGPRLVTIKVYIL